jgi:hypothetical protein
MTTNLFKKIPAQHERTTRRNGEIKEEGGTRLLGKKFNPSSSCQRTLVWFHFRELPAPGTELDVVPDRVIRERRPHTQDGATMLLDFVRNHLATAKTHMQSSAITGLRAWFTWCSVMIISADWVMKMNLHEMFVEVFMLEEAADIRAYRTSHATGLRIIASLPEQVGEMVSLLEIVFLQEMRNEAVHNLGLPEIDLERASRHGASSIEGGSEKF